MIRKRWVLEGSFGRRQLRSDRLEQGWVEVDRFWTFRGAARERRAYYRLMLRDTRFMSVHYYRVRRA